MAFSVAVPPDLIGGGVDEGYGKVADAFRANFTERGEIGASVAVYRDGVKVVDLWGGYRDGLTRSPWQRDPSPTCSRRRKALPHLPSRLPCHVA